MEKDQKITIDDYNCEYRSILEQGINLLRYGLSEEEIEEFLEAARKEPEMASFINRHMNCGVLGWQLMYNNTICSMHGYARTQYLWKAGL